MRDREARLGPYRGYAVVGLVSVRRGARRDGGARGLRAWLRLQPLPLGTARRPRRPPGRPRAAGSALRPRVGAGARGLPPRWRRRPAAARLVRGRGRRRSSRPRRPGRRTARCACRAYPERTRYPAWRPPIRPKPTGSSSTTASRAGTPRRGRTSTPRCSPACGRSSSPRRASAAPSTSGAGRGSRPSPSSTWRRRSSASTPRSTCCATRGGRTGSATWPPARRRCRSGRAASTSSSPAARWTGWTGRGSCRGRRSSIESGGWLVSLDFGDTGRSPEVPGLARWYDEVFLRAYPRPAASDPMITADEAERHGFAAPPTATSRRPARSPPRSTRPS